VSLQEGIFEGLSYRMYGSGNPVIALHGFGATSYSWRHLIPAIASHRSLYLFDLKGHGKSEKPRDGRYSLNDQTELICRFIDRHDLTNLTLLGHSMGGGIALLTALKLLEDGKQRLSSLILIDSIAFPQKQPYFIRLLRIPVLPKLVLHLIPATISVRMVLRQAYFDKSKMAEDAIKEYAGNLADSEGIDAIVEVAKQVVPERLDHIISKYHTITIPTLILWGREDQIVLLENGASLNRMLAHSSLHTIGSCGHIPHEERPDDAVPVILHFLIEEGSSNVIRQP
jgi:pimeloyl-ACP methyl ester carboxylesterase